MILSPQKEYEADLTIFKSERVSQNIKSIGLFRWENEYLMRQCLATRWVSLLWFLMHSAREY